MIIDWCPGCAEWRILEGHFCEECQQEREQDQENQGSRSPMAEASGLSPVQCQFKSDREYKERQ